MDTVVPEFYYLSPDGVMVGIGDAFVSMEECPWMQQVVGIKEEKPFSLRAVNALIAGSAATNLPFRVIYNADVYTFEGSRISRRNPDGFNGASV